MKKLLGIVLGFAMVMTSIVNAHAFQMDNIDKIKMQIANMGEGSVEVKDIYPLNDVNGDYSYDLYEFVNGGYTIATHENAYISELMMETENPYVNVLNYDLYYMGPYNYFYKNGNNLKHVSEDVSIDLPNQVQTFSSVSDEENNLSQIQLINNEMLSKKVSMISTYGDNVWYGTATSKMTRYSSSSWKNQGNTCGPHAAAVMMAYLDDYRDNSIVASSIRTRYSSNPENLIARLISATPSPTATYPSYIYQGVKAVLGNNSKFVADYQTIGGTWNRAVREINLMGVVCIGLLSAFGSSYGDHWVTGYRYMENSSNKGYFMCVDNWGGSAAKIEASWTCGLVWIEDK